MTPDAKTPPEPRPAISRMQPYEWEPPSAAIARQAGVPEDQVVRFDTNTFPWPGAAVDRLAPEPLNEYPDTSYRGLTDAIAGYTGVSADHVTVGAGADEVLDLIAKAYIDGSAAAVISRPTYPMFTVLTEMSGVTGLPLIDRMPNVVVVRTLSKAFGLAGARVGYALAGPAISQALRRVRPPGSISVLSAALAVHSLTDLKGMRERVERITSERTRLQNELAGLGLEVRESAANFLLVRAGRQLAPVLLRSGLVVRTFPAGSQLADFIRVTVRLPQENDRLIAAVQAAMTPTG